MRAWTLKKSAANMGGRNQLQLVVLLLAVTVLLPTVCLLWFIGRSTRNERLAVRQKLLDIYQGQLDQVTRQIDEQLRQSAAAIDRAVSGSNSPAELFAGLATGTLPGLPCCRAAIIYDAAGRLLYPAAAKETGITAVMPSQFDDAWQLEFVQTDFAAAADRYTRIAAVSAGTHVSYVASLATVRCLRKAGRVSEAVELCRKVAYAPLPEKADPAIIPLVAQARVLLVTMQADSNASAETSDITRLMKSAIYYGPLAGPEYLAAPSTTRMFLLSRTLELLDDPRWTSGFATQIETARALLAAEQLAASVLQQLPQHAAIEPLAGQDKQDLIVSLRRILEVVETSDWAGRIDTSAARELLAAAEGGAGRQSSPMAPFERWAGDKIYRISGPPDVFASLHQTSDRALLLINTPENLPVDFAKLDEQLEPLDLSFRVIDDAGSIVTGSHQEQGTAFMEAALGEAFPGWRIELFSTEANAFERAASRQIAITVWTGALVIVLVLAAGAAAAQVTTKQMRLNKMKNDFIATVSHELKTPLASMRVLVDTLLEGHIKSENQTEEYLRLVSKENERLSRMIDNFLTFSRMERNKKVFTITDTNPAVIAADAVEAVKTKFAAGSCRFTTAVDKNLPDITADHDAMVTVLVNLLDNAYKYTYDEKEITLRVSVEDSAVCFAVSDNGIGIARRHIRRVFDSFYQVDRTLARRAEGCGLGLSIVRFIVDAHKGKVTVESRPGKGSTFKVRIPISARPAD